MIDIRKLEELKSELNYCSVNYIGAKNTVEFFEKILDRTTIPDEKIVPLYTYDEEEEVYCCCTVFLDDFINLYNSTIARRDSLEKKCVDLKQKCLNIEMEACKEILQNIKEYEDKDYKLMGESDEGIMNFLLKPEYQYLKYLIASKLSSLEEELVKLVEGSIGEPVVGLMKKKDKDKLDDIVELLSSESPSIIQKIKED